VIRGIYFDFGKDSIRKKSAPTLNAAAKIFAEYPGRQGRDLGHTDDVGKRDYNVDLATRRAESVKQYLVEQGRGGRAHQDPRRRSGRADRRQHERQAGRAKNRRIEFKILLDSP
jgi:OOP family OmpA-OmpF porin